MVHRGGRLSAVFVGDAASDIAFPPHARGCSFLLERASLKCLRWAFGFCPVDSWCFDAMVGSVAPKGFSDGPGGPQCTHSRDRHYWGLAVADGVDISMSIPASGES